MPKQNNNRKAVFRVRGVLKHIEGSQCAQSTATVVAESAALTDPASLNFGVDEALIKGTDEGFKPSPNGTGSASPPAKVMAMLPDVTDRVETMQLGRAGSKFYLLVTRTHFVKVNLHFLQLSTRPRCCQDHSTTQL